MIPQETQTCVWTMPTTQGILEQPSRFPTPDRRADFFRSPEPRNQSMSAIESFDVRIHSPNKDDRPLVVQLFGAADMVAVPRLEKEFAAVAARKPAAVVLDLTGLHYISSIAIGQIVALWEALRAHNGTVVITNPIHDVRAALDRVNLGVVVPVVHGSAAAYSSPALA
jgi:anti-anti-sigma factor